MLRLEEEDHLKPDPQVSQDHKLAGLNRSGLTHDLKLTIVARLNKSGGFVARTRQDQPSGKPLVAVCALPSRVSSYMSTTPVCSPSSTFSPNTINVLERLRNKSSLQVCYPLEAACSLQQAQSKAHNLTCKRRHSNPADKVPNIWQMPVQVLLAGELPTD